jgi:hypothetical protein
VKIKIDKMINEDNVVEKKDGTTTNEDKNKENNKT